MAENDEEKGKPRRLDEETAKYLAILGNELKDKKEDDEDSEVFIENVLNEIKTRTASAASDRRTHDVIEKICILSNSKYLLDVLSRFQPYAAFLAENRYSAHVIQAALSKFCYIFKHNGFSGLDSNDMILCLTSFANNVFNEVVPLMKDLNGSHVIRSLISALAGMSVLSERKGKESKHQHSVIYSEPFASVICQDRFYVDNQKCFPVPDEFHECLGTMAASLLDVPSVQLHDIVGCTSGCAVFSLLLRVLYSPELIRGGPELAERLVRTVLCWGSDEGPEVMYAIAGDKAGSYFLETTVECCSLQLLSELHERALRSFYLDYCNHASGNFVIQSLLKRLSTQIDKLSDTTDNQAELGSLIDLGGQVAGLLFPHIRTLLSHRGGVVLWLLDLELALEKAKAKGRSERTATETKPSNPAKKKNKRSDSVVIKETAERGPEDGGDGEEGVGLGLTDKEKSVGWTVLGIWTATQSSEVVESGEGSPERNIDSGSLVAYLDGVLASGSSGESSPTQLLVGKILGVLLKGNISSLQKKSRELVVEAICSLSQSSLLALIRSGPLSRAVMDSLLENETTRSKRTPEESKGENFEKLLDKMVNTLMPRMGDLATHFVSHHVLRRLFQCCGLDSRKRIAQNLLSRKAKLQTSREGKNLLQTVYADLLERDESSWVQSMNRQRRAQMMLGDLETTILTKPMHGVNQISVQSVQKSPVIGATERRMKPALTDPKQAHSIQDASTSLGEPNELQNTGTKRIRKRKRKGDKNSKITFTIEDDSDRPVASTGVLPHGNSSGSGASNGRREEGFKSGNKKPDFKLIQKLSQGKLGIKELEREIRTVEKEKMIR